MTETEDHALLIELTESLGPGVTATPEAGGAFTLKAEIDGVVLAATVEPAGRRGRVVQVEADAPGAGALEIELYPEGLGSSLGKVFGAQDVEVGESRFDDRYMIKASDEGLARLWLDLDLRRLVARAHPDGAEGDFQLRIAGERASIRWREREPDRVRVEATLRAVAALGRRSRDILDECRQLAEAAGGTLEATGDLWEPEGGTSIRLPLGELTAKVDFASVALETRRPTLHTRIVCAADDADPEAFAFCRPDARPRLEELFDAPLLPTTSHDRDVTFHFWAGSASGREPSGRIDPRFARALLEAMPTAVTSGGGVVTLWLAGFLKDVVRLRRLLALLGVITGQEVDGGETRVQISTHRAIERGQAVSGRSKPSKRRERSRVAPPVTLAETLDRTSLASGGNVVTRSGGSTLALTVRGVRIELSEVATSDGPLHFRMEAACPGPRGLELRLIEGDLDPFAAMLGAQDLQIGDGWVDERYVIKATDLGYAAFWLSETARNLISLTYDPSAPVGYTYWIRRERLVVERGEEERDPGRLESAILAAVTLAERSLAIVGECRALAEELRGVVIGDPRRWTPESGVSIAIGRGAESVTIGQVLEGRFSRRPILMTRVNVARQASGGDRYLICKRELTKKARRLVGLDLDELDMDDATYAALYWAGGEDADALRARLDERTRSRLVLAEPEALVASEREITIWCRGFVRDLERIQRLLKVIDALGEGGGGSGPSSPYR